MKVFRKRPRFVCFIVFAAVLIPMTLRAGDYTNYVRLFSFGGTNGANPQCELLDGTDGRLYGTTPVGGLTNEDFPNGMGVVFALQRDGTDYQVLHYFGGNELDGKSPRGALIEGSDGFLYGTTQSGGASNRGTIFKLG